MTVMKNTERQLLASCALQLNNWIGTNVHQPITNCLGFITPELHELQIKLNEMANELRATPTNDSSDSQNVCDDSLPLLKCALIHERRRVACDSQKKSKLTFDRSLKTIFDENLEPYTSLMDQEWFKNTKAYTLPKITDYLMLKTAVEILRKQLNHNLSPRTYDEKFGILNAPTLMLPDLGFYRVACEIRKSPLSVAYIDIDDFKKFNSDYGEPKIDRDLLPQFMNILESHVYPFGHAYRYGGDEYMILLPNMRKTDAAQYLSKLQNKLGKENYFEIVENPTISIGICEINEESYLTNSEVEDLAAWAKSFAKKQKGKSCIALYDDTSFHQNPTFTIYQPTD